MCFSHSLKRKTPMIPRNDHVDLCTRERIVAEELKKIDDKLKNRIGRIIRVIHPSVQWIVDTNTLPAFTSEKEFKEELTVFMEKLHRRNFSRFNVYWWFLNH